jgi:excisionase family DNA binding protein
MLLLFFVADFNNAGASNMRALKSVVEAAGLLGISPWTVRAYIHDGKLRPVRLGRRVLLEETELERFIADGREQAKSEPHGNQSADGRILETPGEPR